MARDTSFFTLVKEQVDLEDYLSKHLGVELVPEGAGRMAAVCPFHDEDTPSFKVMESDDGAWKRWWCFGACQEGGSVIDAAMKAEGYETAHEAAQYLNELYGLGLEIDNEAYKRFARTVQETKDDIQRTREEMADPDSKAAKTAKAYLQNRGFSDETIDFFQLGVDTGRTKAGRLSIPLIDKANHPVSVANRALFDRFRCLACKEWVEAKDMVKLRHNYNKAREKGEDPPSWKRCPHCDAPDKESKVAWLVGQNPKYLFIRDFDKANFLYNEHGTRQVLARDENTTGLFLVEGYADVWSGWQSNHKAICSYNGAELSDWQAKEAIELVERAEKPIILVPDFDETGQGRIDKNVRKLRALKEDIEIQIIHSLDRLTYDEDGERIRCKDLGDVLKHFGPKKVSELLDDNRWQASEWQIREVVEATNPRTGEPFFSMSQQLQICAEILAAERSKVALDHLIPYLVEKWDRKEEIVRNWFYSNLSQENATSYQHLFKDIDQAREEAREFLQDDNVIPIGFDDLDRCMPGDGARPGQLAMFLGKALSVDSKILTMTGWKRMGDMKIGDSVVDPDGGCGNVTGVFPQGKRELYRVVFSDGSSVECDREHLWHTEDYQKKEKVQTLGEIIDSGKIASKEQHHQIYIPLTEPVEFALSKSLPVDPYVLGAILAGGSLSSKRVVSPTADSEIIRAVWVGLSEPHHLHQEGPSRSQDNMSCAVESKHRLNPLMRSLKKIGLLDLESQEKFIPEIYLGACAKDRLQLLRGLMDSDSSAVAQTRQATDMPRTINDSTLCGHEFYSASRQLAEGVVYLVRSLGGTAKITKSTSSYINKSGVRVEYHYRVKIMMPETNPCNNSIKDNLWSKSMPRRKIVSIEPVGSKPAQCITVDTKRSLYITDDFIVTHNSGTGKAQPVDSSVLTPSGWRLIGKLQEGEDVVDPTTGRAIKVTGVFPQGEREIYEVAFSDGSKCRCDVEHLWSVENEEGKKEVITLREIIESKDLTSYMIPKAHVPKTPDTTAQVVPPRYFASASFSGLEQAVCIAVDSPEQLYITDDLVVTHNTMLASQILAHMADQGVRSIIFTLEQAAKSLFPRLVCQALDISPLEAEELIARDDEEAEEILRPVRELYKNMLIIDNVPGEGSDENLRMTPARIQAIIQEANMTHFAGEPAAVVAIDHLGILEVDDDAPREIKGSENMRPGYIMQRLFSVCKTTSVFMMVLQQLPKEVEPGVPFGYDAGRGGSAQTDFCDYIFQIWRPEQRADLDDAERAQYSGQYKLSLGKNRYGPSKVAHLMFDKTSLRIMPVLEVTQPDHQNEEAVIDLPDEEGDAIKVEGSDADGATEAGARAIEEASPNPVPQDTKALLDALGDDDDVEELGDPSLRDWFTS